MAVATADIHARPVHRTAVRVVHAKATVDLRVTADIVAPRATAEAAVTIQRRAAEVATIPVAEAADALTAVVVVGTTAAAVVDTQAVAVVAATPVAEDMEVTAKKLGDAMSLREAATGCIESCCRCSEETEAGRACLTARPLCFQ